VRDLLLDSRRVITVRIGVKPDALHVGGLNLFGRTFGNYPQDLTLRIEYAPGSRSVGDSTLTGVASSPAQGGDATGRKVLEMNRTLVIEQPSKEEVK
jgi:hypothetical protein